MCGDVGNADRDVYKQEHDDVEQRLHAAQWLMRSSHSAVHTLEQRLEHCQDARGQETAQLQALDAQDQRARSTSPKENRDAQDQQESRRTRSTIDAQDQQARRRIEELERELDDRGGRVEEARRRIKELEWEVSDAKRRFAEAEGEVEWVHQQVGLKDAEILRLSMEREDKGEEDRGRRGSMEREDKDKEAAVKEVEAEVVKTAKEAWEAEVVKVEAGVVKTAEEALEGAQSQMQELGPELINSPYIGRPVVGGSARPYIVRPIVGGNVLRNRSCLMPGEPLLQSDETAKDAGRLRLMEACTCL
jgi:chromosome segregation ATPase